MTWTHYCDRCGAEMWRNTSPTSRVQRHSQVTDGAGGTHIAALCEACTVKLGHWLDTKGDVEPEA